MTLEQSLKGLNGRRLNRRVAEQNNRNDLIHDQELVLRGRLALTALRSKEKFKGAVIYLLFYMTFVLYSWYRIDWEYGAVAIDLVRQAFV